jgi:hypothetical protein
MLETEQDKGKQVRILYKEHYCDKSGTASGFQTLSQITLPALSRLDRDVAFSL